MTTRRFWKTVATVVILTGFLRPAANGAQGIHFFAIGDAGSGTQMQKDVAEAMAKYAAENREASPVNFVLVLGDNFYESGVTNVNDRQWDEKFERMYDQTRLPMPFIAVLGNHDWRGDLPDVEIQYGPAHLGTRWQMDGHWFKRHYSAGKLPSGENVDADFFFIDTEIWNPSDAHVAQYADKKMGEKQMQWLRSELEKSKARWKFVCGHHPLYSNGQHGHDRNVLDLRERLLPLLLKFQVNAYFSGHDHDLQRIEVPEVPTLFLISGAAGKLRTKKFDDWKPFYASTSGFLAVQLSPTEMRGRFVGARGNIVDEWRRAPFSSKTTKSASVK